MKFSRNQVKYLYDNMEIGVIIFFFSWMVIITSFTVLSRYFFSFTFTWAEQTTRVFFVIITFAGISLAATNNAHLKVTVLATILPKKISNFLILFGDVVTIGFSFLMAYEIFQLVLLQMEMKQTFAAIPGLPVWVMYLPGTIFLAIFPFRIIQYSIIPKMKEILDSRGSVEK